MHKFIEKLKGRFWLLSGVIIYLSTAISSIYRSLDSSGLGSNLYMAVDWLAACIIYFFFGAMIGFALDWFMSGKSRKKYGTPWWLILTVYLWLLSSLVIALVNKNEAINMWLIIFFPLAFGVFYSGFAFTLLSPKAFEQSCNNLSKQVESSIASNNDFSGLISELREIESNLSKLNILNNSYPEIVPQNKLPNFKNYEQNFEAT